MHKWNGLFFQVEGKGHGIFHFMLDEIYPTGTNFFICNPVPIRYKT